MTPTWLDRPRHRYVIGLVAAALLGAHDFSQRVTEDEREAIARTRELDQMHQELLALREQNAIRCRSAHE